MSDRPVDEQVERPPDFFMAAAAVTRQKERATRPHDLARARVYATLAVAQAIDRLTEAVKARD